MSLQFSPSESARFSLRIFRGSTNKLVPQELLSTILDERIDVAILRLPTSEQYTLPELSILPWPTIVADTLVRFDGDLRSFPALPMRNPYLIARRATVADRPMLTELIDLSFKEYRTHYNSNPLFDSQLVLEGYKEWAISCLEPDDERVCFLFYVGDLAVAFTTNSVHPTHGEGIIFGARPNAPSRGLYTDLIRHTKQYMQDQGLRYVQATTQVYNHGVQRVWVREGLFPARSFFTIHINALQTQRLQ